MSYVQPVEVRIEIDELPLGTRFTLRCRAFGNGNEIGMCERVLIAGDCMTVTIFPHVDPLELE